MSARGFTLTEPGFMDGHPVRCCPSSRHVWDSPDGFAPADGREVKCRTCPATARAIPEGQLDRLLRQVAGGTVGAAQLVLRAALDQALRLTPPEGDAPPSDAAVLSTFWGALELLPRCRVCHELLQDLEGYEAKDEISRLRNFKAWARKAAAHHAAEGHDVLALMEERERAAQSPPAEPDCMCGEAAARHVWSDWAKSRPCNEAEDGCGCLNYTPKEKT